MTFNAHEFDEIARNVFAPAYPLLASQIIAKTGITTGTCLDLGSGGGYLGLALAGTTALRVCLLDESGDMREIAAANIAARNLEGRVRAIKGDVHEIPLPDASMDLVVSRGSLFFWHDLPRAFREVRRVLAPGGQAYLGGGFGSSQLRDQIVANMRQRIPEWMPKFDRKRDEMDYGDALGKAGIRDYAIRRDESGFWITFRKQDLFRDMREIDMSMARGRSRGTN